MISEKDREEYKEYLRLKRAQQEEIQYLKNLQERMNPKQYGDPDLPLSASREMVENPEDKPITPKELAAIVGQSATYGFGDELLAAGQAAKEVMSGDERLQDIYDIYRARQKENEAAYKKIEETHPKTAMATDLAAGLLIPGLSFVKGAKLAANPGVLKKILSAAKHAAKEGAVIGGLYGAGSSEGDIENPEELLTDTATGSTLGATLGGTLVGTGSAVSSAKKAASNYIGKKITPSLDDIYDVLGGIKNVSDKY